MVRWSQRFIVYSVHVMVYGLRFMIPDISFYFSFLFDNSYSIGYYRGRLIDSILLHDTAHNTKGNHGHRFLTT